MESQERLWRCLQGHPELFRNKYYDSRSIVRKYVRETNETPAVNATQTQPPARDKCVEKPNPPSSDLTITNITDDYPSRASDRKTCTYLRYGRETETFTYRYCEQQYVCKSHPISRVSEAKEKIANKKPLIPTL